MLPEKAPDRAHRRADPDDEPLLPVRSQEDMGIGWGEPPEPDDERLHRERPPHWDSA
jgi:hypothetical protein